MNNLIQIFAVVSLTLTALAAAAADMPPVPRVSSPSRIQAPVNQQITGPAVDHKLITERVAKLHRARDVLLSEAAAPLPNGLSPDERSEARRYHQWLKNAAKRLDALAKRGEGLMRSRAGSTDIAAQKQMKEMNMSFNMQYLQLQNQLQAENRKFTLMSNIMKTRHDTAKNAISNIR